MATEYTHTLLVEVTFKVTDPDSDAAEACDLTVVEEEIERVLKTRVPLAVEGAGFEVNDGDVAVRFPDPESCGELLPNTFA